MDKIAQSAQCKAGAAGTPARRRSPESPDSRLKEGVNKLPLNSGGRDDNSFGVGDSCRSVAPVVSLPKRKIGINVIKDKKALQAFLARDKHILGDQSKGSQPFICWILNGIALIMLILLCSPAKAPNMAISEASYLTSAKYGEFWSAVTLGRQRQISNESDALHAPWGNFNFIRR